MTVFILHKTYWQAWGVSPATVSNWSNEKIGRELGMDPDEVLRLSQISGLAEMFADREFSQAWEATSINEADDLETASENAH